MIKLLEGSSPGAIGGLVFVFLSTVGFLVGTMPPLHAATKVVACYDQPLPGPENTLNPHAPKDKQVQDTAKVCDVVVFPDAPAHLRDRGPITDHRHDVRAIA